MKRNSSATRHGKALDRPGKTQIAVSIVSYNSRDNELTETVASLNQAAAQLESGRVSLTLTDNSPNFQDTQRLASIVRRWLEQGLLTHLAEFVFLQTGCNLGYGRANNQAVQHSNAQYILILNPDVIMEPDALQVAIDCAEQHPEIAMVTPRAFTDADRDLYLNRDYPSVLALLGRPLRPLRSIPMVRNSLARYELRRLPVATAHDKTRCASGCFMFIRGSYWEAVNGFDPDFFLYFEDYDLSLRLLLHGEIRYEPKVRIRHAGGQAASKGTRHQLMFAVSAWRFFQKHGWQCR